MLFKDQEKSWEYSKIHIFNWVSITIVFGNADFDGDILNTLALTMEAFWELFAGLSPTNMLINRVSSESDIRYDVSALENITLAIFSDM